MLPASVILLLLTQALAQDPAIAPAPKDPLLYLDAAKCGVCHPRQHNEWSISAHAACDVQCTECHGQLHSGSLTGCKRCHQAIHRKRLANWPEVTRFDDHGSTDHVCMVCHHPHLGKLKVHLTRGCFDCHGDTPHTVLTDVVHRQYAASLAPISLDTFAREKAMAGWLYGAPSWVAGIWNVLRRLGIYALCFVGLLPAGYAASAIWGRRSARGNRE